MMRSAWIMACGLVLTGALAGSALATTEPAPSGAEEPRPSEAVPITLPASETRMAPAADAQVPDPAAKPDAAAGSETRGSAEPPSASTGPDAAPAPTASEAKPDQPAGAATAETAAGESKLQSELLRLISEAKALSSEERDALTAFYQSRGEDLLWITGAALNARSESAIAEIRRADDWGLEASAFELPSSPRSSEPADVADVELKLTLAVLKYASHARGGRMDPKQLSNYIDRKPPLLPPGAVLTGLATTDSADGYLRGLHPRHPQFEKLRQAYLATKRGAPPPEAADENPEPAGAAAKKKSKQPADGQATLRKLLHNMEQWRWMPEDLGRFYVWANVPEFTLRVMEDGEPIHTERLIAGKRDTQTPIFSDEMETIVVHPFWGVPDSIKVKELLPSLARGGSVLAKNNLRIQYRGRDIDPASVDWARTDIRNFHVYQPPGGGNVLGVVKFLFPNEHQVYMHDTPTKNLFAASQRMFSHGCMRVRNPVRLAEILLSRDKGWDDGRVASLVKGGPSNNHITLDAKVPVHITYFTAWVDEDGKVSTRPDVYGHEQRIQMGLEGKAHLIARKKEDLGPVRAEVLSRLAESGPSWSSPSKQPDWIRRVFGN
ncbi:MAG: L,D-transpeptidase family protein [Hyphomicrobiaceae bacterium]|nr:L,D-transpeptidase family protein [Hyphomicrobiaceae bacterium]